MDLRGSPDLFGRELRVSVTGHADEIAAAASLVMEQSAEGQPVVVCGLTLRGPDNGASELVRPAAEDYSDEQTTCRDAVRLLVVANTGDDFEHLGLSISPDVDTLTYTLAGIDNPATGWGRRDETWSFMEHNMSALSSAFKGGQYVGLASTVRGFV